ncbi:SPL family radical SAM protein [Halomonas salina]|uniref:SPL family radical SAM protein n=1 Tax=Halomonas salina TaxID=42565 RepID=UPI001269172D|nr:radical SAM protein [Halomonas salina]
MQYYKYYSGITSQVGFCATPLRLDSYNKCQFGCEYCFASTRQGYGRDSKLKVSNPDSLRKRLERVQKGVVSSALDEFIEKRIPFQLGGMSDPFSKIEESKQITLEYLKILRDFDYPVIISTKSDAVSDKKYLDLLKSSNSYVRFSTTVVQDDIRKKIDQGCPDLRKVYNAAEKLVLAGVPVSFRFQPIIPTQEPYAQDMIAEAERVGVSHISAEYLKVPLDANVKFGSSLKKLLGNNPIRFYKNLGACKQGREYILPLSYREKLLTEISHSCRKRKISFGFADNDLLIHSDGMSCCNASDLYLNKASYFHGNIVHLAKVKRIGELIRFSDYLSSWIPSQKISTYLNSKSRVKIISTEQPDWLTYLGEMWKGEHGIYSPDYFDGIEKANVVDELGFPVYVRVKSSFERKYESYVEGFA